MEFSKLCTKYNIQVRSFGFCMVYNPLAELVDETLNI